MSKKLNLAKLTPVLFSFFVMGFVDIVNISTNYVKQDFALNDNCHLYTSPSPRDRQKSRNPS